MEMNAGKEDRARVRASCALDGLRRAWRNTFFVRHYESPGPADASAGPLAAQAPAVVIPAGCVMIDSALGEVPPLIFGLPVNLEFRAPRKPRAMTSAGARRVQAKKEKRAARRSKVADHVQDTRHRHWRPNFAGHRRPVRGYTRSTPGAAPLKCPTNRAWMSLCATGRRVPGRRPTRRTRRNV